MPVFGRIGVGSNCGPLCGTLWDASSTLLLVSDRTLHSPQTSGLQRLQWLAGGFLLTFSSAFGQTFFIALFASDLKGEFGLRARPEKG